MTDKKMQDIQIAVMQEQMNMAANMARAWANMKWGNGRYQAIVNMLSETSWKTDRDVQLEILKARKRTVLRFLHKCNERWKERMKDDIATSFPSFLMKIIVHVVVDANAEFPK